MCHTFFSRDVFFHSLIFWGDQKLTPSFFEGHVKFLDPKIEGSRENLGGPDFHTPENFSRARAYARVMRARHDARA